MTRETKMTGKRLPSIISKRARLVDDVEIIEKALPCYLLVMAAESMKQTTGEEIPGDLIEVQRIHMNAAFAGLDMITHERILQKLQQIGYDVLTCEWKPEHGHIRLLLYASAKVALKLCEDGLIKDNHQAVLTGLHIAMDAEDGTGDWGTDKDLRHGQGLASAMFNRIILHGLYKIKLPPLPANA